MANSTEKKRAFELGRQLAAHFNAGNGDDQTIRWMAYFVGEQIARAENATGEDRTRAEQTCYDTILALWNRRHGLPDGARPFEKFEAIAATIARIDPANRNPFYYARQVPRTKPGEEKDEVTKSLEFVEAIDEFARSLISTALGHASEKAATPEITAFIKSELGEDRADLAALDSILKLGREEAETPDENKLTREIARLDVFTRLAAAKKREFKQKLSEAKAAATKAAIPATPTAATDAPGTEPAS